jgi:hypothetical protein
MRHGRQFGAVESGGDVPARTAWEGFAYQPSSTQPDPVRRGERVQVVQPAQSLRPLARKLNAYEPRLAIAVGITATGPPLCARVEPCRNSKGCSRWSNALERLVSRLKGFRRAFSCFDELDVMIIAFLCFALLVDALG